MTTNQNRMGGYPTEKLHLVTPGYVPVQNVK